VENPSRTSIPYLSGAGVQKEQEQENLDRKDPRIGDNLNLVKQNGTSKTTKNTKKFPTGLVANWQKKISKTLDDSPHRAISPLGGLEDDDARGEQPDSIGNRYNHYKTEKTRKNDVCFILFWA
jgi:hypothetical protein